MKSKNIRKSLSLTKISRLRSVFESLGWSCERDELDLTSKFERFIKMLEIFDDSQQNLVLDLTKRYLEVYSVNYSPNLKKVIHLIPSELISSVDTIYFLPLKDPDPKKLAHSKSGDYICYSMKDMQLENFKIFEDKNPLIRDFYKFLPSSEEFNGGTNFLFLVDDYIGSGSSAETALNYLTKDLKIDNSKIGVLSIVAQIQGLVKIRSCGVQCFALIKRTRGISDYYDRSNSLDKLKIIAKIGDIIGAPKDLYYGFENTEALVSMIRTPNNTFPMYYRTCDSKSFIAPFNR